MRMFADFMSLCLFRLRLAFYVVDKLQSSRLKKPKGYEIQQNYLAYFSYKLAACSELAFNSKPALGAVDVSSKPSNTKCKMRTRPALGITRM